MLMMLRVAAALVAVLATAAAVVFYRMTHRVEGRYFGLERRPPPL
jgi:hypothetical protein